MKTFLTISPIFIDFGLKSYILRVDLEKWITGRTPHSSYVPLERLGGHIYAQVT